MGFFHFPFWHSSAFPPFRTKCTPVPLPPLSTASRSSSSSSSTLSPSKAPSRHPVGHHGAMGHPIHSTHPLPARSRTNPRFRRPSCLTNRMQVHVNSVSCLDLVPTVGTEYMYGFTHEDEGDGSIHHPLLNCAKRQPASTAQPYMATTDAIPLECC
ncbi:hypothetical protein CTA2_9361 [Colletotrichum tanaceti]|nr:hypothetical protein CTA2_9361 [Colletotrichum tanaceti]